MNLQLHLLTRIVGVATICLLAMAAYSLHHSKRQAELGVQQIADSLAKQLESQLLHIRAGLSRVDSFPNFDAWKQAGAHPGICVAFTSVDGTNAHSLCQGEKLFSANWPKGFEALYSRWFEPGRVAVRLIRLNDQSYGTLSVTPSSDLEIAAAWDTISKLLQLSGVTILTVSVLVYLSIHRALRPAQTIVAHLNALESGRLDKRLPAFKLSEWQRIGAAIDQMAASQQLLLAERQTLIVKLMQLQEEERRLLASELHDEFGQCLAAINAVTTSIKQTAVRQQCDDVVDDADSIGRITAHMLQSMRSLLRRLRPAEFDELGLAVGLKSLLADWHDRNGDKVHYQLRIEGDCGLLSEAQAMALFRVAQEALTNIVKHAQATQVAVTLEIDANSAVLTISDDGVAHSLPFDGNGGIGLLGMRERITALAGALNLALANPHGLIVEVSLPVNKHSEAIGS